MDELSSHAKAKALPKALIANLPVASLCSFQDPKSA
jgi:hypothetical protein